jgi:hypothetical protein
MAAPVFPESFFEIINAAVARHKDDTAKAVAQAIRKIRELPEFSEWINRLAENHIASMVHNRRHRLNKAATGERISIDALDDVAAPEPRVVGREIELPDVVSNLIEGITLDYFIGSKTLGAMSGLELRATAARYFGNGHKLLFLSQLCNRLARIVQPEQQVRDVVTNAELSVLVAEVQAQEPSEPLAMEVA